MKDRGTVREDTVEIEFTPEEMASLSRAAEAAHLQRSGPSSFELPAQPRIDLKNPGAMRFPDRTQPSISGTTCTALALAAFAVFLWWSAERLYAQQSPPIAISRSSSIVRPALPALPVLAADAQKPNVKVRNPFDAAEVFEFPAGTSAAESREKVAQVLLQRARGRRSQWAAIKRADNLRAANFLSRSPK